MSSRSVAIEPPTRNLASGPLSTDVLIVGGGAAGTATAIGLARRGQSVVVVEASAYDRWRPGEIVPPEIQEPLRRLGLAGLLRREGHLLSQAVASSWGSPELRERHGVFNPNGFGWVLDRARFDATLARSAEEHGATVLRRAQIVAADRESSGWSARVQSQRGIIDVTASVLVDATGRARVIAHRNSSRPVVFDRTLCIVAILSPDSPRVRLPSTLLLEAAPLGWWYSSPLPSGGLIVVCVTDADILAASDLSPASFWARELGLTSHTARRTEGFSRAPAERVYVRAASSARLRRVAGPGWLAVGDAAASHDPLSGWGLTSALHSSLRAAEAIHEASAGGEGVFNRYAGEVAEEFARYLEDRVYFYGLEERWESSPFWRRRRPVNPQRAELTLDPEATLQSVSTRLPGGDVDALLGLLPLRGLEHLLRLCATPRCAHEIAAEFMGRYGIEGIDLSLLVAMQELIKLGLINVIPW
jgi:flavin-dependent dehydrogenase